MIIVLDTNVLVSALLTPHGPPGRVLDLVLTGELTVAFDDRILDEYHSVLRRPKFGFADHDILEIVDYLAHVGFAVVATPLTVLLPDGDDLPFLEVASAASAILVTGNARHYPEALCGPVTVMTPAALLDQISSSYGATPR